MVGQRSRLTFSLGFALLVCCSMADAASMTLVWDPSPTSNVAGYIVLWRTTGTTTVQSVDVGNATSYAFHNLTSGTSYTFGVRAYLADGTQSPSSAEISAVAYVDVTLTSAPAYLASGQSGTWSVRPIGFDGPVEYQFRRYSATGGWQTVRSYGTSASYSWTPGAADTGTYRIEVSARLVGSAAAYEARTATSDFTVADTAAALVVMQPRLDFDGDGRADLGVYRPSTGMWYVLLSGAQFGAALAQGLGGGADVPVPGDYDGDGRTDVATFRPATNVWTVLRSDSGYTGRIVVGWGMAGDIPVPADYDGDRRTDFAVFRPSNNTWYVLRSDGGYTTTMARGWGMAGDIPVPSDFDGDRRADLSVFRPSNSTWYVLESITGYTTAVARAWGMPGDKPVVADYDGDHRADPAVYRPSNGTWYILHSLTGFTTATARTWGTATDLPVPADYEGNGLTDVAYFRPSTSTWFVWNQAARTWGMQGDIPLLLK